jgi:hypothetical protein
LFVCLLVCLLLRRSRSTGWRRRRRSRATRSSRASLSAPTRRRCSAAQRCIACGVRGCAPLSACPHRVRCVQPLCVGIDEVGIGVRVRNIAARFPGGYLTLGASWYCEYLACGLSRVCKSSEARVLHEWPSCGRLCVARCVSHVAPRMLHACTHCARLVRAGHRAARQDARHERLCALRSAACPLSAVSTQSARHGGNKRLCAFLRKARSRAAPCSVKQHAKCTPGRIRLSLASLSPRRSHGAHAALTASLTAFAGAPSRARVHACA